MCERKVYLADATDVTEVVVSDTRKAMAQVAASYYDNPSQAFSLVGITGTNGKTTTTYLVEHIAKRCGKRTGVIGTVGIVVDGKKEHAEHTTPESPDLQATFAKMRDAHVDTVAMEVSSHALDLLRTWGTRVRCHCVHQPDAGSSRLPSYFRSLFRSRRPACSRKDYPCQARCQHR